MEKVKFDEIIKNLDERISVVSSIVVDSSEDICKLSVNQLRHKVDVAKLEKQKMDVILGVELYHILGMGNLSAVHKSIFCKRIATYSSYRYGVEFLSTISVPVVGKMKTTHSYECKNLGIKLYSDAVVEV